MILIVDGKTIIGRHREASLISIPLLLGHEIGKSDLDKGEGGEGGELSILGDYLYIVLLNYVY